MKNKLKLVGIIAIAAIIAIAFAGCPGDPKPKPQLTGTVSIDGILEVGETLTAIVNSNGTAGKFTYQWTKTPEGGTVLNITGADGQTYVITEDDIGHTLGVDVTNDDTTGKISSVQTSKVPQPVIEPIPQSHTINFGDKGLAFNVKYEALPNTDAPEYLDYLETRLTAFTNSAVQSNIDTLNSLISKSDNFIIKVEYDGAVYGGLVWDTAKQAFTVHNDWISNASGVGGENALTLVMMRDAFNSVKIVTARLNTRDVVRMASVGASKQHNINRLG